MADSSLPPAGHPTDRLVGTSSAMAALRAQIRHLAPFDSLGSPVVPTLLLQGETGTGKGLVARVIHDSGPRAIGPFIAVNCAAIPESLLEAELFGFEAGAFTDAKYAKPGLFEAASGGTLFLDEIDALPLVLQGKLLTALESKRVRRLGAVTERTVDVKLIAATNAVLPGAVAAGRFRADLYHRLAVVVLALPPLRERGADILVLAQAYLRQYTAAHGVPPKRLTAGAEAWLQRYAWPGNVRELSHVMERVILLHTGEAVEAETLTQLCLPLASPAAGTEAALAPPEVSAVAAAHALPAEATQIRQALAQTGGNVTRAARLLGVSRDTVRYRMQRYGMTRVRPAALPAPEAAEPAPLPRLSSLHTADVSALGSPALPVDKRGGEEPPTTPIPPRPLNPRRGRREKAPQGAVVGDASAWEHKPVAVLALEVTWPAVSGWEPFRHDPWTTAAGWEQAIMQKVQGFGGLLLQASVGLFLWVFGLPQALEQLPQRAVHSALAIRQMVAAAQALELGPCPTARLAVHLGAVQVGRPVQALLGRILAVGDTIARPIRLLGHARPWELVVSPEVGRLVEGWFALEARVSGYAVLGARPGRAALARGGSPPRSPFVGRGRELTLLEAVLAQVQAGRGQVVGLVGAAGMGKSRLLAELRQRLNAQGIPYGEGQCLAYGSATPYLPVMDLVRDHCGISEDDQPKGVTAKVRRALEHSGSDLVVGVPLLLDLLGMAVDTDQLVGLSADARRACTFETLGQLFLASSQRQPLVLAVENLHWIDPTSEAFLALLIEQVAGVPLLVLTTTRPGYRPPWGGRSYVTQLALAPLDPEASRQVVRHVLAQRPLAPAVEQQLLAKAEGNPFFLEELAHTVREQEGPHVVLAVPDTIQAVLAARLDRLPGPEKRLVQAAAVIGKEVAVPLLQALLALPEATLHRGLAHLQAAEFLFPRSVGPTPTYTFKHILTQEAVYQSVPGPIRRQDHQRVAQVLAEHFPALAATQPELLAHHYTAAGLGAQAIVYWQQAGRRAVERSAHLEAVSHLTQGLEVLKTLPDSLERTQHELSMQLALGTSLMATRSYAAPETGQAYRRALALSQQMDAPRQRFTALRGLWQFHLLRAELTPARALGEELLSQAQQVHDPALLLEAHRALGTTLYWRGELAAAQAHFEQGLALYDPQQHRSHAFLHGLDPGVTCLTYLALVLWGLGAPDQASQRSQEALTLARELAHPVSLTFALTFTAMLHQFRREAPATQACIEADIAIATEQGFLQWVQMDTFLQGWALAAQGHVEAGIAKMGQGMAAWRAMGADLHRPYFLAQLAEAQAHVGQVDEGLQRLAEAFTIVRHNGECLNEAELYRLQGELLLAQASTGPTREQAEAAMQQALDVARRQQAKSLELRAAMSLSRLWQQQGKRAEAYDLLASVYGWFTEGFDTTDLREAKALLEELS